MKLHQISEPEGITVGIDLGTTNSLIGYYDSKVIIIPDKNNKNGLVPSAVLYTKDGVEVGYVDDNSQAITSVKRLIGKGVNDKVDSHYDIDYDNSSEGLLKLKTEVGLVSPIQVSAEILKYLKKNAEEYLERSVTSAVITVPAHFDDAARIATKEAAKLAGLNALRIINEPTAAAIAYGLHTTHGKKILVYDLGGGTFDVSILKNNNGVLMVVATGGDNRLGGDDFDRELAILLANKAGFDPSTITKAELSIATECKKQLSHIQVWSGEFLGKTVKITLDEALAVWKPLITKTIRTIAEVIFAADMSPDDIDDVILAGGSTRMPAVHDTVKKFFNKEPLCNIDPDQVVVIGATLQAMSLTDGGHVLVDVVPLSLGLEILGGVVEVIIPRNTSIPIIVKKIFTTYQDNQTGFKIHVVQGESSTVDKCRSLGKFELKGITPKPAGEVQLEISFKVDADGILFVSATELETGNAYEIEVKPSYGLSEEEMVELLSRE